MYFTFFSLVNFDMLLVYTKKKKKQFWKTTTYCGKTV